MTNTKLYKRHTSDIDPTAKVKDVGAENYFTLAIKEVLHSFQFTYPNLVAFSAGYTNVDTKTDSVNGSFTFWFHLAPQISLINFQFHELLKGEKWKRFFNLPMPHRYLGIDINMSSRSSYTGAFTSHVHASLGYLIYTAKAIHDDKLGFNEKTVEHIGAFLPNSSYFVSQPRFCPNWNYTNNKPMTVSSISDALFSTLENYCWSSYNNHWFGHLFSSASTAMLIRDFGPDVKFQNPSLQLAFEAVSTLDSKIAFSSSPYYAAAQKIMGTYSPGAMTNILPDYYAILELLEKSPNYWTDLSKDKILKSSLNFPGKNQFVYARGSRDKLLESFTQFVKGKKTDVKSKQAYENGDF